METARQHQYDRYQPGVSNAKVPFETIIEMSPLTAEQIKMITTISAKYGWSNRVQIKIIRLARTISDLAGEERISDQAIWEAMTLRRWGLNKY
ncbi:magnesium chelatase subunit ChlI family protein [Bacillus litorisediminis]|uniref:magnesium chelatase subunit ChlI family protein n=1 Tax=Bacillus litorisediminis TaxID=2922713 RepID=UPI001FAE23B7|nr:hypothetical protein [Bacillus litorisediminis]